MKIFVAGATGAIGRQLVPMLVARGHEVVGTARSQDGQDWMRSVGAEPVALDVLDRKAVLEVIGRVRPEVVVHQATALSVMSGNPKKMGEEFAETNRLRTEGTDNLLAAARAAGARRFVAQSFTSFPFAREGGPVKDERDPLDPHPPEGLRGILDAIRYVEETVTHDPALEGVVLRYGGFYGPGTSLDEGGAHIEAVRHRKFPVVGNGAGIWSFVHIEDAASATVAAIEGGAPGIYNVVDDEPAPVKEWLPELAATVGAPPPRHVPRWLGKLAAGDTAVVMMTESRGASNAKAKRELGWQPRYATWRQGFKTLAA
jgi:nucleoside-diphosphate-sugar epimerase